uniref:Uncharacterized protein n=1 Tax=Romanomermis culicivorax TaxID=13658 RepID=A0A915KZI4_ROMCU
MQNSTVKIYVKWCQCKCGTPRDSFQFDSEFVSPAHLLTRIQGQMVQNTVSDTLATKNHVILRQDENQSSVNRSVMTNCSPIEETVQRLKARSKMAVGKVIDTNQTVNPPNNLSPIPKRTMIRTISCRKRNPVAVVSMNETERKMFMHRLSKQALYASNNQKTKMIGKNE